MRFFLLALGQLAAFASVASVLVYAPFARNWIRALCIPVTVTLIWSVIRVVAIFVLKEPDTPLFGIVFAPFGIVLYAALARGLKLALFEIPLLSSWERRMRDRFGKHSD